jgi:hypothetical protein
VTIDRQLMQRDLAAHLARENGVDLLPQSTQADLKSYIVEAHPADTLQAAVQMLNEGGERAEATVRETDDPSLFLMLATVLTEGQEEEVGFWIDVANPRFWLLHTKTNASPAAVALRRLVGHTPRLDTAWLPRNQLRSVQSSFRPFGFRLGFDERPFYRSEVDMLELEEPTHKLNVEHAGVGAEGIYELLETNELTRRAMAVAEVSFWRQTGEGTQLMRLTRQGRLRSTGQSLDSHLQAARSVIRSYERFIVNLERSFGLHFAGDESGGVLEGRPLSIRTGKPEGFQFHSLVERLVSGVEPFRILGTVDWHEEEVAWVEAVDLHTGAPLRMDLTPSWMRIYLGHGLCGNTLARFITNLQRAYDASLSYFDDDSSALFAQEAQAA